MKTHLLSSCCVLLAVVALWNRPAAAVAYAPTDIVEKVTPADIERTLRSMGFEFEHPKENLFKFQIEGLKVLLFIGSDGTSLQLFAGFTTKVGTEKVNEWNRDKRFSRAYVDKEGDAVIESDLDLEGGVTWKNVEVFIRTFRMSLNGYYRHISNK